MPDKYKKAEFQSRQSVSTDISSDAEHIPVSAASGAVSLPPVRRDDERIPPVVGAGISQPAVRQEYRNVSGETVPVTLAHTATSQSHIHNTAITQILLIWDAMSYKERQASGGVAGFARLHNLNIGTAHKLMNRQGLTERGKQQMAPGKTAPVTDELLREWDAMSPEARQTIGGVNGFTRLHNLNINTASSLMTSQGLTPQGKQRVAPGKTAPVTDELLREWDAMSPEERQAIGGIAGFARQYHLHPGTAHQLMNQQGLTERGKHRVTPGKTAPVTDELLREWDAMSPEARQTIGGVNGFTRLHNLNINTVNNLMTSQGLTSQGKQRVAPGKTAPITVEILREWAAMSPEARQTIGITGFALQYNLNIDTARRLMNRQGLTERGTLRVDAGKTAPATYALLQEWDAMPPGARQAIGGIAGFALLHNLNIYTANNLMTSQGLTPQGKQQVAPGKTAPVTDELLQEWAAMSPEARQAIGGVASFALQHNLNIYTARNLMNHQGLKPRGKQRVDTGEPALLPPLSAGKSGQAIHSSLLPAVRSVSHTPPDNLSPIPLPEMLPGTQERLHDSRSPASGRQAADPMTPVTSGESASPGDRGPAPLPLKKRILARENWNILPDSRSPVRLPETRDYEAGPSVKRIKTEDDVVSWQTHQMRNDLPILQDWHDPTVSVLTQAEGDRPLKVTRWGELFTRLPRDERDRINQDIQWFLQNEGQHGARMLTMMEETIPLDDEYGDRGRSVFARHYLPAGTVLGPYSGRYMGNAEALQAYEKEYGPEAANYYFATLSKNRTVAAYPEGNILSLINHPDFNRRQTDGEYRISDRQNVSTVVVGKNINFYVTTRDIGEGEELWFDYDPTYEHFEPHQDLRAVQIKTEPGADTENTADAGRGLAWLGEHIHERQVWREDIFEAMPSLISRSATFRGLDALLVIVNRDNEVIQIVDSRTGEPSSDVQNTLMSGRRLSVIRHSGNDHYDAWVRHGGNVVIQAPDTHSHEYRVDARNNETRLIQIAGGGYCMTEAAMASLLGGETRQELNLPVTEAYGYQLREEIRQLLRK